VDPINDRSNRLRELAFVFLRLGTTAFGGPAAHIAMMEEEVVRRRGWVSREEFLDLVGVTNLIPGPNSTEMAIHIGHRRGGWPGLLIAGMCFIVPAMLMVWGLAWMYVRYGSLPRFAGVFQMVKPVVLAVIVQALWSLGRSAARTDLLRGVGLVALTASLMGVHELIVLLAAGVFMLVLHSLRRPGGATARCLNPMVFAGTASSVAALPALAAVAPVSKAWPLFLFFAKVGSVLYGSGYVLLAFLQAELVDRRGWLTQTQLLDAVAVGQFTPGPVFTTATFVGYLVAGSNGAVLATLGIFLPAFVFVAMSGPLVPRLRRSAAVAAVLDGVNVASLALMAAVAIVLGRAALSSGVGLALFAIASLLLIRFRMNSAWLILGAAAVGLAWAA